MNIIRVKLPHKTARFKPFTVGEYRDLLLIRNDMESNVADRKAIFDELLEELYPDYTPFEREYIFLNVLNGSTGKAMVDATFTCPKCGATHRLRLKLSQEPMTYPELTVNNITFKFKMPNAPGAPDSIFLETLYKVSDGVSEFDWDDLRSQHDALIDMISFEEFSELAKSFKPIRVEQHIKCCVDHHIQFDNMQDLFMVLINPAEVFNFYKINRALVRHDYSIADIMGMFPVERSIVLSLVEKELKDKQ